jgi:hypothetical protein
MAFSGLYFFMYCCSDLALVLVVAFTSMGRKAQGGQVSTFDKPQGALYPLSLSSLFAWYVEYMSTYYAEK